MTDKSSREEIAKKVAARIAEEEADLQENEADSNQGEGKSKEYDMAFIRQCYLNNEVGDSILYNSIHRGRFIFNVISERWMVYRDPYWEVDHEKESVAAVETVAVHYLELLLETEEQLARLEGDKSAAAERKRLGGQKKAILQRLDRLRSDRGRNAVLRCCISNSDPLTVHPDRMDQDPWLLPCENCVVDLRTGESRPGRPEDYITMASPIEWKGLDEPAPTWDRFLQTAFDFLDPIHNEKKQEVIDYLLRVLGYAITGLNTERFFVVFHGKHGQNGKGSLMEILFYALGQLCGPIQTEMLMATRFTKGADGPSPAVMALKGRRLGWASETEEGQSFAAGKLKLYSGGDPLIGRNPNDRDQTIFMPSHTLFLLTNNLPGAPASDSAFWERMKVIELPLSFVKRNILYDDKGNPIEPILEKYQRLADPKLMNKLKAEAPGILAALVRGCIEWQRKGLSPPRKVLDDSAKYRRREDDIQEFIEQCCDVDKGDKDCKVSAKELYNKYREWWEEVSVNKPMSMKKFGELMAQKFEKFKSSKIMYLGVRLKAIGGDNNATDAF